MKATIRKSWFALAVAFWLPACVDMDIPDLNNASLIELERNPTPSAVFTVATGLLIGHRVDMATANGYLVMLGIIGREAYNFDAADPRYITEMLQGPLDPGSPRFGGHFWAAPYSNIRNANILLRALEVVGELSAAEKEAVRGFAMTMQALDFLVIINTRDENGAPIDVGGAIDELGPIVSKEEVFAHIATLLDEAEAHLRAGGDGFPFPLSSGFYGFDTPQTFIQFNRAIKARVDVYRGDFSAALVNLEESFLHVDSEDPQFYRGVYHVFGTGSGDTLNGLNSPNIFAHPSIVPDADEKADGTSDDRLSEKIMTVEPLTVQGLTSDKMFTMYQDVTAPLPIIRNEELILLRAEANIGLGNIDAAAVDINYIRLHAGGLEERSDLTAQNILDELLKQKRYSLLLEGGHRWIDLRRYAKLDTLPLDQPNKHVVHERYPIPVEETDARE